MTQAGLATPMTLPASTLPVATPKQRQSIESTAHKFEGQLMALMLQPMFEGLQTDGPFGGGQSESTYRSLLVDSFGKQMAKAGGMGLAAPVAAEMLRMQGLQ